MAQRLLGSAQADNGRGFLNEDQLDILLEFRLPLQDVSGTSLRFSKLVNFSSFQLYLALGPLQQLVRLC